MCIRQSCSISTAYARTDGILDPEPEHTESHHWCSDSQVCTAGAYQQP